MVVLVSVKKHSHVHQRQVDWRTLAPPQLVNHYEHLWHNSSGCKLKLGIALCTQQIKQADSCKIIGLQFYQQKKIQDGIKCLAEFLFDRVQRLILSHFHGGQFHVVFFCVFASALYLRSTDGLLNRTLGHFQA